jgi:pimeloyl-ACP methyl ester carboxylesterase
MEAQTRADDGMELLRVETFQAPSASGLPSEADLTAKIAKMAEDLKALKNAPVAEPYDGPALLSGRAAANRAWKIEAIAASGYGVFMLNYRRYGGSGGWPTEANNVADANAAFDYLRALGVPARDIVAYGESLGTAVATWLALQRPVRALVLEAPFTSVVDVGLQVWWFLPLRLIMTDQYRTIDRIGSVRVPLLILHGARDSLIPVSQARQIYAAANEPKSLAILRSGGHNDLFDHGAWEKVTAFFETPETVRPAITHPAQFEPVALAS